jgi:hypothetical protein
MVPLFLTCGSPIPSAKIASEGISFFTCLESATSICLVVEPIFKDLLGLTDDEYDALVEEGHISLDYLQPDGTPY